MRMRNGSRFVDSEYCAGCRTIVQQGRDALAPLYAHVLTTIPRVGNELLHTTDYMTPGTVKYKRQECIRHLLYAAATDIL
jgi:hypothetical protein